MIATFKSKSTNRNVFYFSHKLCRIVGQRMKKRRSKEGKNKEDDYKR